MKTLGIVAGPRKGEATDSLVDSALNGLKDRGADVEKIYLYDLDIRPCTGCCACHKTNRCVIDDDQRMVLDRMGRADVIVFGSPTYFSNVTSEAKKFFDRGLPFFTMTALGPRRFSGRPKKAILITVCGAPYPFSHILGIATGSVRAMKVFFGYAGLKMKTLAATGMEKFDKKSCGRILRKAYDLGRKI